MKDIRKRFLITIKDKVVPFVEEIMESDFIDNPSQLFHQLVVDEWKRRQSKVGRPKKEDKDTENREGMVWLDGDDMNPGRWVTEAEANLKAETKTLKR